LPAGAHAELATITKEIEATLVAELAYDKINYLMLMMVDPHVHFHIFPRYSGARTLDDVTVDDAGWPGPPDLKSARKLDSEQFERLRIRFFQKWLTLG
jgi:diadenosine tetraphosphate (Ap4A) HIT family hydrolase